MNLFAQAFEAIASSSGASLKLVAVQRVIQLGIFSVLGGVGGLASDKGMLNL